MSSIVCLDRQCGGKDDGDADQPRHSPLSLHRVLGDLSDQVIYARRSTDQHLCRLDEGLHALTASIRALEEKTVAEHALRNAELQGERSNETGLAVVTASLQRLHTKLDKASPMRNVEEVLDDHHTQRLDPWMQEVLERIDRHSAQQAEHNRQANEHLEHIRKEMQQKVKELHQKEQEYKRQSEQEYKRHSTVMFQAPTSTNTSGVMSGISHESHATRPSHRMLEFAQELQHQREEDEESPPRLSNASFLLRPDALHPEPTTVGKVSTAAKQQLEAMRTVSLRNRGQSLRAALDGHADPETPALTPKPAVRKVSNAIQDIVESDYFNGLASLVIVANTIVLGIQTDIEVANALEDPNLKNPDWFRWFNILFLMLFSIELLLRFLAERLNFFIGHHWPWNLFDAFMIFTAVFEEASTNMSNFTFFRVIKVVRMFRAIRILRVFRYFADLRLMVCSIMASFKSLAWAFILLLILIYCCAVVCCQSVSQFLCLKEVALSPRTMADLKEFYRSVPFAMYSLLLAVSGGKDWYDLVHPLGSISPLAVGMFIVYTLFVIFGMLNVLTGVFVDRASELSHLDRDLVVESEKRKIEDFSRALKKIFQEMDHGKGVITWPEFNLYCQRDDVQAYLASMQLAADETKELFHMLDAQQTGAVNIEDFIYGCLRVKGQAKSLDLLHLQQDIFKVKKLLMLIGDQLITFFDVFEQRFVDGAEDSDDDLPAASAARRWGSNGSFSLQTAV